MSLILNTSLITSSLGIKQAINELQNAVNSITNGVSITSTTVLSNSTIDNWNNLVTAFANNGDITLTLPVPNATGQVIEIIKMDNTANTITVQPTSGTINGLANFILYNQYDSISIKAIGGNSFIFSGNSRTDDGKTF